MLLSFFYLKLLLCDHFHRSLEAFSKTCSASNFIARAAQMEQHSCCSQTCKYTVLKFLVLYTSLCENVPKLSTCFARISHFKSHPSSGFFFNLATVTVHLPFLGATLNTSVYTFLTLLMANQLCLVHKVCFQFPAVHVLAFGSYLMSTEDLIRIHCCIQRLFFLSCNLLYLSEPYQKMRGHPCK